MRHEQRRRLTVAIVLRQTASLYMPKSREISESVSEYGRAQRLQNLYPIRL